MWRPAGGSSGLTYRLLAALLDELPGESSYKTAVRDALDEEELLGMAAQPPTAHGPWSHEALRLANIEDLLKWLIFAVYAAQGGKPKQPEPTPRPGVRRARPKRISSEAYAHLQKLRAEHEALYGDTSGATVIELPGASGETG